MADYTYKEAVDKLHEVYESDAYNQLKARFDKSTYLEDAHKQRSETVFSALLAWMFNNHEFNKTQESAILFLLRLLAWKSVDKPKSMDSDLRDMILSNDIYVKSFSVRTERQAKSSLGNGSMDIVIVCELGSKKITSYSKKIRIVLENKVNSVQHDDQCAKYYDACTNDEEDFTDIFVYLSIDASEILTAGAEDYFIKITYQELYDGVLRLLLKRGDTYPEYDLKKLQDFTDTITSLKRDEQKKITKLAMDDKTKKLLRDFYENNKELIAAAVLENDEDDPELAKAMKESRNRDLTRYSITYNGKTVSNLPKAKVAYEAIKMLRDNQYSPNDITKALAGFGRPYWVENTGQDRPYGYNEDVEFATGEKYYINTQIYNPATLDQLKVVLASNEITVTP